MVDDNQMSCPGCSSFLVEPYIRCIQCGPPVLHICLHCFARGLETGQHESNHQYEVIKNDFALFESGWTAAEEIQLLDAVADCGFGNWTDVSNQLRTKNRLQCEQHYRKCYLESPKAPLPELEEAHIHHHPTPVVFKLCEDPPRPAENSTMQFEMSGYMAARGDFMTEHDNYAEMDLRDLSFKEEEEDQLDLEIKLTALDIYMNRLKERDRRKRIIRDHGLINIKKIQVLNRRFEKMLGLRMDALKAFCRLMQPMEYDMYLEGLLYEAELKQEIKTLQKYRAEGITKLRSAKVYERLARRRTEGRSNCHMLSDVLNHMQDESACQQWLQRQAVLETISKGLPMPLPSAPRRTAPPLDIVSLPGYDRLTDKEKELCSQVRLVPESYQEFKSLLISECNKLGSLKLAQARTMIKIDVNKTRKVYDFLVQEGHLNKDP